MGGKWNVDFTVQGSGIRAQANCCAYALARCFMNMDQKYYELMKPLGLHRLDPRRMERKRVGLYSARVRPPFVRR